MWHVAIALIASACIGIAGAEVTNITLGGAKKGLAQGNAEAICNVSKGLKDAARDAWLDVKRTAAWARALTEASELAAEEETQLVGNTTKTQTRQLLREHSALANRMAANLTEKATQFAARAALLAGKIDQWIETLGSMVHQAGGTGYVCIDEGADVGGIAAGKAKIEEQMHGPNEQKAKVPKTCRDLLQFNDTPSDEGTKKRGGLYDIGTAGRDGSRKLRIEMKGTLETAASATEKCPLLSTAAETGRPGLFKDKTILAGLWSAKVESEDRLKITEEEEPKHIIQLAEELRDLSPRAETHNGWQKVCKQLGTDLCTADNGEKRKAIRKHIQQEAERLRDKERLAEDETNMRKETQTRNQPQQRAQKAPSTQTHANMQDEKTTRQESSKRATSTVLALCSALSTLFAR